MEKLLISPGHSTGKFTTDIGGRISFSAGMLSSETETGVGGKFSVTGGISDIGGTVG